MKYVLTIEMEIEHEEKVTEKEMKSEIEEWIKYSKDHDYICTESAPYPSVIVNITLEIKNDSK